jgi:hypothetical protein
VDCSDRVALATVRGVHGYSYDLEVASDGSGLAQWTSTGTWQDGAVEEVRISRRDQTQLGRDLLARGTVEPESWPQRHWLGTSLDYSPMHSLTVDLGATADVAPALGSLTPYVASEDASAELWSTVWLRIEDPDHDVDPGSVSVANLTRDGGAESLTAYYAAADEQVRPEGSYGWFVVRMPLLVGSNQLAVQALDRAGHQLDDSSRSVHRYVLVDGEYPEPAIDAPADGLMYYPGFEVQLDASSSVVPDGYEVYLAALVDDGSSPMTAAFETWTGTQCALPACRACTGRRR